MANVAFLFTGVSSIAGGGGAERFFSDFFEDYQKLNSNHRLFFISDKESLASFNSLGNLKNSKNVLSYKIINNRFKNILESIQLTSLILRYNIKLIQIPLYNMYYYPIVKSIDRLPKFLRPKITLTITDSFIPYYYFKDEGRGYNFKKIYEPLFQNVKIDSVISWYKLFKEFVERK